MHLVHAMNTVFGQSDQFGVRSLRICARSAGNAVSVYAKGSVALDSLPGLSFHAVKPALRYQALRYAMAALRQRERQRRAIWRGFDLALAGLLRDEREPVDLFHTWEWVPEAIRDLKARFPAVKVVRDVVVNRFNEYYSGTPITAENELVDYFFSPSSFSTDCLISWGIPSEKIIEVPFGVDCEAFKPLSEKPEAPLRFCFTGGVSVRKGVDSLLRVWKRLELPGAELHLYGRVRDDVKKDLDGAKNVFCHGHVPLAQELPKNHVYVFPSTLEGSAKSAYEALACGLPVITTPDSGSVVRHGVDGFIVPKGDDGALAEAMRSLSADAALRERFGAEARLRAEAYTWDRYAASVWDAYGRILQS